MKFYNFLTCTKALRSNIINHNRTQRPSNVRGSGHNRQRLLSDLRFFSKRPKIYFYRINSAKKKQNQLKIYSRLRREMSVIYSPYQFYKSIVSVVFLAESFFLLSRKRHVISENNNRRKVSRINFNLIWCENFVNYEKMLDTIKISDLRLKCKILIYLRWWFCGGMKV